MTDPSFIIPPGTAAEFKLHREVLEQILDNLPINEQWVLFRMTSTGQVLVMGQSLDGVRSLRLEGLVIEDDTPEGDRGL